MSLPDTVNACVSFKIVCPASVAVPLTCNALADTVPATSSFVLGIPAWSPIYTLPLADKTIAPPEPLNLI